MRASGRADDYAVILRQRIEAVSSQLAELKELRARVIEVERNIASNVEKDLHWQVPYSGDQATSS